MIPRLIASLAATAILVAACGSDSTSEPSPAPTATSATSEGHTQGSAVPARLQFTAKTIDGEAFSGENVLGQPAVF